MKVKELIETLNKLEYSDDTEIRFGSFGAEDWFEFKIERIDDEYDVGNDFIFIDLNMSSEWHNKEVRYIGEKMRTKLNEITDQVIDSIIE